MSLNTSERQSSPKQEGEILGFCFVFYFFAFAFVLFFLSAQLTSEFSCGSAHSGTCMLL